MSTKKLFSIGFATSFTVLSSSSVFAEDIVEPAGLNQIHEIIDTDARLNKNVSLENKQQAHAAIDVMNRLIFEAITVRGLANDSFISAADTREINQYLVEHYGGEWYELRGEKLGADSTGYYAVERKGARTSIMASNAVSVWGGRFII